MPKRKPGKRKGDNKPNKNTKVVLQNYTPDVINARKAYKAASGLSPDTIKYKVNSPTYDPGNQSQLNSHEEIVSAETWAQINTIITDSQYQESSSGLRRTTTVAFAQSGENCMQHAGNRFLSNIISNQFNLNNNGRDRITCILIGYITSALERAMVPDEVTHVYEILRIASGGVLKSIDFSFDDELITPKNNADNINELETHLQSLLPRVVDVDFKQHNINYVIINLLLQDNMMSWMSQLCDDKNKTNYSVRDAANEAMRQEQKDIDVSIGTEKVEGVEQKYFYKTSNTSIRIAGHSVVVVGFIRDRNGKIIFLKIRGSWTNCDTKYGFVLLAWEGVLNHLYNNIIATYGVDIKGGITKRKRKRKRVSFKKPNKSKKQKQTRRRIKTRRL